MSIVKSFLYLQKENNYNPIKLIHIVVYGFFPRTYSRVLDILMRITGKKFQNYVAETYHAKVVRLEEAEKFITINKDLTLTDLEHVLPYKYATDIILKNPDNIVALECPCRGLVKNPCTPTDVCLLIGEPFADLTRIAQPHRSRRISSVEALEILRQEDERGHIHTAWFNTAMLNRFYTMCNCCKCCCYGLKSMTDFGINRIQPSGYRAVIEDGCHGCGKCVKSCQFDAIELIPNPNNKTGKEARIIEEKCFGCSVCETKCKQHSISIIRDPEKGTPLDIEALGS